MNRVKKPVISQFNYLNSVDKYFNLGGPTPAHKLYRDYFYWGEGCSSSHYQNGGLLPGQGHVRRVEVQGSAENQPKFERPRSQSREKLKNS